MSPRSAIGFAILRPDQLRALRSPLRQEILDAVAASGPMSVAALARVLGRAPDSLYYHVRGLTRLGLLDVTGRKRPGHRSEMVFDVPGRPLHIPPRPGVATYRSSLRAIVAAMLGLARRQHAAAVGDARATLDGARRNLWASRVTGWLTADEVADLNTLLLRVNARFRSARGRQEGQLLAFTFVLTPVGSTTRRAPAEDRPPARRTRRSPRSRRSP
jgi:DNA-binding transcriptional ArsR family regulator